jgi:hypothetical protein
MVDLVPPFHETLRHVVGETIQARSANEPEFGTAHIAKQLGVGLRNFQHYMEHGDGMRHCPAQLLPALCRVLGNYEILDALEAAAGRIAFRPPEEDHLDPSDIRAAQGLVQEVGEALRNLAETLHDGVVDEDELHKTVPTLDDVIRECVALKYWLQRRQQQDAAHTQKPRKRR